MATGIAPGRPVCDSVRRLAYDRLQPAVDVLSLSPHADPDDVIHDVRKRCKRVRALLRLVRNDIGEDVYRRENVALRDASRSLSPVRDAAVMVQVHDDVVRAGALSSPDVRSALRERHEDLRHQLLQGDALPRVRQSLAAVVARSETWPVTSVEWDLLGAGIKRVYRRGRKAMAAAYEDPSTERFHQWRNRVKYLRHQLRFLEELWPDVLRGNARSAGALSDVLGDEHDLAVLERAVVAVARNGEAETLASFVASHRELLRVRARPIGLRLYAEKPSRFVARLGRYWEAGVPGAPAA